MTGGVVVRDPGLPTLLGRYVYADFFDGDVRSFVARPRRARPGRAGAPRAPHLISFGEDACGHVYVVSLVGSVDRIQDGAPGTCVLRPAPSR